MSLTAFWQRLANLTLRNVPLVPTVHWHAWKLSRVGNDGSRFELPTAGWKACELATRMSPGDVILDASVIKTEQTTGFPQVNCPACIAACDGISTGVQFRRTA